MMSKFDGFILPGSGIVRWVGDDVSSVQVGDKVILSFNSCGACRNCKIEKMNYCEEAQARNWSGLRSDGAFQISGKDKAPIYGNFFGQSSFCKQAVVNGSSLVKVPGDVDLRLYAPLGCGIQTGTGVVWNTLDVCEGESIMVAGCGAVGMSAIMAARIRKAGIIIAVDLSEERLSLARALGATHTFLGSHAQVIAQAREILPLPHAVKYAFDTTGVPSVIEMLIEAVGLRGKVAIVGATPLTKKIQIQPLEFLNMGKQLVGSVEGESRPTQVSAYSSHYHCPQALH